MSGSGTARKVYLNPGELLVAEEPAIVSTVLGSCVAVTLYAPRLAIGGICHAVLPSGVDDNPSKYADQSVRYMLDFFREHKVAAGEIVAKVFGGADMFAQVNAGRRNRSVGALNILTALDSLRGAGVEPAASSTGGHFGRKLVFYTHTGEAFVKRVNQSQVIGQGAIASLKEPASAKHK